MEKVSAYKASDGALLETEELCVEYEISLIWRERINDFTKQGFNPYPRGAHAVMTRKIIIAWENFKARKNRGGVPIEQPTGETNGNT